MRRVGLTVSVISVLLMLLAGAAQAEGWRDLEKRVVEKDLPNGLKVIILPRPEAPVVSMVTYADVGGVDENQNATGLAHVFEHMAFKGTTTIGTTDYAAEKKAMQKEDAAFLALREERRRRPHPDEAKLKELEAALKAAQDEAREFVVANEIGQIIEQEGGQGLNAFTSSDQTVYLYSLPANKLELWAALESDRFTNPVIREFYKELDVIMEEKRMGESNPIGRLISDFIPVAFKAHMYRSYVIGHLSDLKSLSRADAEAWFKKYYGARNLTVAIVGDVDPKTVLPMLEKHLGKIPAGQKPGRVITEEPPQRAEKRIIMEDPSQPVLVIGYHMPDVAHPDHPAYKAMADILGGGRSSRLYKSLVKEKKLALMSAAMAGLAEKYPSLFLTFAMPNKGKTNAECEAAIYEEIEKLQQQPVTPEELEGVKARAKSAFIDSVENNTGLALNLAKTQNLEGDWRRMFRELEAIDQVTAADIQRLAQQLFVRSNRTVGMIENNPTAKPVGPGN